MFYLTPHNRLALIGTLAASTQLLIAREALAHAAHGEAKQSKETETTAEKEHQTPSTKSAGIKQASPSLDKSDAEANVMPSSQSSANETAIQETPASQETSSVSRAELFDGFSIGLGESLLGLVIVGPFLLFSLRKRLQS